MLACLFDVRVGVERVARNRKERRKKGLRVDGQGTLKENKCARVGCVTGRMPLVGGVRR